jgi:PAS domain S-box-containing protein
MLRELPNGEWNSGESEAHRVVRDAMPQGVIWQDGAGTIVDANPAAQSILGLTLDEMRGRTSADPRWKAIHEDGSEFPGRLHPAVLALETGEEIRNVVMGVVDPRRDEVRWISVDAVPFLSGSPAKPTSVVAVFSDITDRKEVEHERDVLLDVLSLISAPNSVPDLLRRVVSRIREWSGCEAVGIRLRQKEDFPYAVTTGFPAGFIEHESRLWEPDAHPAISSDEKATGSLQCLCGAVLLGQFNPGATYFTEEGSFWTNNFSVVIDQVSRERHGTPLRGFCVTAGYESVALVPLRAMGQLFGLLQINDRRKKRFSAKRVAFFERLAGTLALGLAQRQAAENLRFSEQRWQFALEGAGDGVWDDDRQASHVYHSKQWKNMLGFAEDELLDASAEWEARLHPDDREAVHEALRKHLSGEIPVYTSEYRLRCKDGSWKWILARGKVMSRDREGNPLRFVGTHADITERKHAEEALRASEEARRTLIENIPGAVFRCELNHPWRVSHMSAGIESIAGVAAEEFMAGSVSFGDLILSEDLPRVTRLTQESVEQHQPYMYEYRLRHADGGERWVQERGRAVYSTSGKPLWLDGVIVDITERKRVEEALRESEYWLRESQRVSNLGSWVLDVRTGNWTSSETLDELLGIGPGFPRTSESWLAIIHPSFRNELLDLYRAGSFGDGQRFNREFMVVRPSDGSARWVLIRGGIVTTEGGSPATLAGTMQDVTERHQMEEQLIEARKMETVGRLAGGIAHDFNNLLTVVNGYSELVLARLAPSDPLRPNLAEIRRAGERAASLTQQLLAFSRRQVLQSRVINLNELVTEFEHRLQLLVGENIAVAAALDPGLGMVQADPGQISQVLLNLAVNARDAMPNGGRLTISTANADVSAEHPAALAGCRPGRHVMLTVRDSGAGMDEETQRHLFEPFYTTKPVGSGTGLGLATVYGIIQQSGGWISVSSKPGAGSTFCIYLPRVGVESAQPASSVQAHLGTAGPETILIAEDQPSVRHFASTVLRSSGYQVLEAASGEEALSVAASHAGAIHLLLTDIVMPGMSGRTLAARLAIERPGLKILYMSGYAEEAGLDPDSPNAGAAFIPKPFGAGDLTGKVRHALEGRVG